MIGYDVENNTYIYLNLYAHNFIQHPKHSAYFKDICPFSLGYYMNCDTINTKIISTLLVTMISENTYLQGLTASDIVFGVEQSLVGRKYFLIVVLQEICRQHFVLHQQLLSKLK